MYKKAMTAIFPTKRGIWAVVPGVWSFGVFFRITYLTWLELFTVGACGACGGGGDSGGGVGVGVGVGGGGGCGGGGSGGGGAPLPSAEILHGVRTHERDHHPV